MAVLAATTLTACEEGANPFASKDKPEASAAKPATSVRLVDRDVEAPQVFQVTDTALWDGRPSLGGVWVASPDAVDPERVILRNPANGKFVIGALFRRERDNPGPRLQISSDAASALGLLAGQPGTLNVTALRREEVPVDTPDAAKPILDAAETVDPATVKAAPVTTSKLDTTAVAAAIDKAEATTKPAQRPAKTAAPAPAKAAAATPKAPVVTAAATTAPSSLHVLQIGIYSIEANARRAADTLTKAGITSQIKAEQSQGKSIWNVTARSDGDKAALLAKAKGLGFTDAYFISR